MSSATSAQAPARFIVGIDLGTTNSAVAYVDSQEREAKVKIFPFCNSLRRGNRGSRNPAFLPLHSGAGRVCGDASPWETGEPKRVVGILARDHGAGVPGRLVVSAKSWLSPRRIEPPICCVARRSRVEKLSPTEVSARYLATSAPPGTVAA
jgi:molecular chaperone DnaK (HSP70)